MDIQAFFLGACEQKFAKNKYYLCRKYSPVCL